MPRQEIRKAQTDCKKVQVIIDLEFPPRTLADGSVTYGQISQVESKGVDEDGNPSANVYWRNEEVPAETKQALVPVMLAHLPAMLSEESISVDLTPAEYVAPDVPVKEPVV